MERGIGPDTVGRTRVNAGEVRALLARHELLARKDLGQNFLCDAGLAARLVDCAGVTPDDTVLEIGTGLGILTRALAERAKAVVSLEIDAGLVRVLGEEQLLPAGVRLVHGDALDADLAGLVAEAPGPVRLVANLPYAISAPLLRRVLDLRDRLVDWSVMLQAEVGARLVAAPGSKDYGSLTVLHHLMVDVKREMKLAGNCFFPPPKVHSVFLRMRPHAEPLLALDELAAVERFVRAVFAQRRKTLVNAAKAAGVDAVRVRQALEGCGHAPNVRAEALTPTQLLELWRAVAQ